MKIMVCYDGTKAAKSALNVAVQQAKAFKAQVIAVMAMEGEPHKQLHDLEQAEQDLESARAFLSSGNLVCETKLIFSESNESAGEQLVRFAKEQKVDMIVVGIKKLSKLGKVITGSNAQHVILNADCQVITAK
jgi:nucleotide-binding universal stress UspA family protein